MVATPPPPGAALRQRAAASVGAGAARALPGGGAPPWSAAARWEVVASLERQLVGMLVQMGLSGGGAAVCAALRDALARSQSDQVSAHTARTNSRLCVFVLLAWRGGEKPWQGSKDLISSEEDQAPAQARACITRCQDTDGGTDLLHGPNRTCAF